MAIVAHARPFVIGVDTHARNHAISILACPTGEIVDEAQFPATAAGLSRAVSWGGRRTGGDAGVLWVIEGTGTYGARLARAASDAGYAVVEAPRMNARAKELGMQSTTFRNACGLDEDGHLSTARDVAIMSREMLLNHPEIENYCTVWMDTLRGGATQLVNTNKLLKSYNGITGLKTGTTGKAGVCISASASRDDLRLIAVVLGSSSGKERFAAATSLLDYGFAMFESALVPIPADAPKTLPVQKGEEPTLELCYTAPERCLAVKGQGSALQAEVELPQTLEAPIREGSVIGSLHIKNSQGILQSCPIIAAKPVDARSFSGCFRRVVNALWLTA